MAGSFSSSSFVSGQYPTRLFFPAIHIKIFLRKFNGFFTIKINNGLKANKMKLAIRSVKRLLLLFDLLLMVLTSMV